MPRRDRITSAIGIVLVAFGCVAMLLGAFPRTDAVAMIERVWPVLVFVVAMTVVADISSRAGLFDVVARIVVQLAGKGPWLLWVVLAFVIVVFTVFLSLDTTVVLVTPLAVVLARRIGLSPLPYALTVVWLANTGSMLLPISNLTNLLAADAVSKGSPLGFAALTWPAAVVCVAVPLAVIAFVFRRSFQLPAQPHHSGPSVVMTRGRAFSYGLQALRGRPELVVSVGVVTVLVVALVSGVPVWIPSLAAAIILLGYSWGWRREFLSWRLFPLPMILLTSGLFMALGALGSMFVGDLMANIAPGNDSLGALLTTSGLGAVTANLINNLPAYLALEPVAHSPATLVALLIGVNAGPLVTPWASLATLLWYERLVAANVEVKWSRYALLGLVAAPLTVVAATAATWFLLFRA